MMWSFPEEITTQILVKLPARDLWRLRCVSKSWCALIDSPFFINMHLNRSTQTEYSNKTLIFYDGSKLLYKRIEDLFDHNGIENVKCSLELGPNSMVIGSCNGLVLVCKGDDTCRLKNYDGEFCTEKCINDFGIWNPNTGEYKSLPSTLPLPENWLDCHEYNDAKQWVHQLSGFGYDSERDDYVVVKVNNILEDEKNTYNEVDIYSLKLNSWRRIECASLPSSIKFRVVCAVFACGALHWVARDMKEDWFILAFDVGSQEFQVVAKPDNLPKTWTIRLTELKGKLNLSYNNGDSTDFWIMRDYGVKESWIKWLSIPWLSIDPSDYPWENVLPVVDVPISRPLAYSSLGNKMLLNQTAGNLILHNDLTGDTKDITVRELGQKFVAHSCVDSLVRLSNYDTTVIKSKNSKKEKNVN